MENKGNGNVGHSMNVANVGNFSDQGRLAGVIVGQNMHCWEFGVTQSTIMLNEMLVSKIFIENNFEINNLFKFYICLLH
jgi:hypothetical protein